MASVGDTDGKQMRTSETAKGGGEGGGAEGHSGSEGWQTAGADSKRSRRGSPPPRREGKKSDDRKTAGQVRTPSPRKQTTGSTHKAMDQGDGKVVFQQLRAYLGNGASEIYVQQSVLRLHNLAMDRRFKAYLRNLSDEEKGAKGEQDLRHEWQDEAPDSRQEKYAGLRSSWDLTSAEHQGRLAALMREWVIRDKEPQREIENRLQLFHFQKESEGEQAEERTDAGARTKGSYLAAVALGQATAQTEGPRKGQDRLRALCLQPAVPTLVLRERTEDEDKAIVMILTHEIEVPIVPPFLSQSMDAGQLACFEDLFMALEYPVYAHLAPGQRFFDSMNKNAILAQIYVGAEAAPLHKQEVQGFKQELSRITLDMETRVVTVTFKGKQSAARWIGWQMPLAGKPLRLVDYEAARERSRTTHELVELDYYSFTVEARKGSFTSRDMYWLLNKALGLTVQAMTLASSAATGIKEQQWNVRVKATACPVNLRNIGYIEVDSAEVMVHHSSAHVNWPCKLCRSPEHPSRYCRMQDEGARKTEQKSHTKMVDGRLPSSMGQGSRAYAAGGLPRTMEQLDLLLRNEGCNSKAGSNQALPKPPKQSGKATSPRKTATKGEPKLLALPEDWGQTITRTNEGPGAKAQPTTAEETTPAEEKAHSREDGEAMQDDNFFEAGDEEMSQSDTLAEATSARIDSQLSFAAAVTATRVKQRHRRAGTQSPIRGRSPTARVCTTAAQRQKRREEFRNSSHIIQGMLEGREDAPAGNGDTSRGLKLSATAPNTRRENAGSPKRRVEQMESPEGEEPSDEATATAAQPPPAARSRSPKRQHTVAGPREKKVVLQQFMHQFMEAVTGREAPSNESRAAGRPQHRTERLDATEASQMPIERGSASSEAEQDRDCMIVGTSVPTDEGALLSTWLEVLGGVVTDVAANGHCGWIAYFAALYNEKQGLAKPSRAVGQKVNALKKHVMNEMIANLADEMRLHPADLKVELEASGCSLPPAASYPEQVCTLANHYVAQRAKSVKGAVPMHFWVRPAHLKAMAMHARETIYVLDVHESGLARMQAYGYQEVKDKNEEIIESGTVCPIPTVQARALMADLINGGIRPPVMVLRWSPCGNHFQAVTYEASEHKLYSDNIVDLANRRNEILLEHGWKAMDVIPYDCDKTARAAATALTAMRRTANFTRPRRHSIGVVPTGEQPLDGTAVTGSDFGDEDSEDGDYTMADETAQVEDTAAAEEAQREGSAAGADIAGAADTESGHGQQQGEDGTTERPQEGATTRVRTAEEPRI